MNGKNKKIACIFFMMQIVFLSSARNRDKTVISNQGFSSLNSIQIKDRVFPRSVEELQLLMQKIEGPIAIAGMQCSMGGQSMVKNGIIIDTKNLAHIVNFDAVGKTITVQTGISWRSIQEYIDPYNLSLKVMQSYCDFSVGGSLSVNVHGRYVGYGPLIETVQSIKIIVADGQLLTASRTQNSDLFKAALGGYGLLGIIVEVTLSLTENCKIENKKIYMNVDSYFEYLSKIILQDTSVVFHNGDLYPPYYNTVMSSTWYKTDKKLTITDRLQNLNGSIRQKIGISLARRAAWFKKMRINYEASNSSEPIVCWRNYEAGYRISQLKLPESFSTTLLQEYFIPLENCIEFVKAMRVILQAHNPNILNISIRHVKANNETLLSWSSKECCAFVIYYEQFKKQNSLKNTIGWTQKLIDAVLILNGTYYLPYQLNARKDQFRAAYPTYKKFEEIKFLYDPKVRFQNYLWQAYF